MTPAEAERALDEALALAAEDDRAQVVFAVYGALSMGTTPGELAERLVNAPQEAHTAYQKGRRDQYASMLREGWRAPDEVGLRGVLNRALRAVNR